ncbi:MAG: energy-coupling factor ABC transporter ATP-binding protein [Candidatus Hodarchaeales archaeon]
MNVFESLSWERDKPGLIGLLGTNGSGKSSFLRLISGLIKPSIGTITIDGVQIKGTKKTRSVCAYVPENARLFLIGPTPKKDLVRSCNDETFAESVLKKHGISHLADKKLYHLSEGQRRLIAIISAFHSRKKIILLDEPTVGLDSKGRKTLVSLSKSAIKKGHSVIISTNDPRLFPHFDEILVLHDKKICLSGSPADVLYDLENQTGLFPNQTVRLTILLEKRLQSKLLHYTDVVEFNSAVRDRRIT